MALTSKSLINYGIQVTRLNRNLDFKASAMGPELTAVLSLGFYTPGSLATEIAFQMQSVDSDPTHVYSTAVARNILGGTQNRFTIATTGPFLSLLFGTGTNNASTVAPLIGFNRLDYTGSSTYTGFQSIGTPLIPTLFGYNYSDPTNLAKVFGAVNVAASGVKESITFNIQQFILVQFKYEPGSRLTEWLNFWNWAIQQRPFDFTPELSNPDLFYAVNLESTEFDGKGLGFQMKEMLPSFPNDYDTGALKFRVIANTSPFQPPG